MGTCVGCGATLYGDAEFCHRCGSAVTQTSTQAVELGELRMRLDELDERVALNTSFADVFRNKVAKNTLLSDSFIIRAWAVYGYFVLIQLTVSLAIYMLLVAAGRV